MRPRQILAPLLLSGLGALAAASPAAAQPTGAFMTLDRADHESRAGLFFGLLHIEDTDLDEGAARIELNGQYVAPSGFGGYFSAPIHQLYIDDGDDETALGGIEVGGLMAREVALGQELALHVGVVLPTAQGDDFEEVIANVAGVQSRLTDLVQAIPETSTLRLGGSFLGSVPGLVYRFDGGMDVPLLTTDDDGDVAHDPILRLNGAVGLGMGPGTLSFELINLFATGNEDASFSDSTLTNAGVSLGVALAGVRLQGGLFLSVDSVFEDDTGEGLITFALAGAKSW